MQQKPKPEEIQALAAYATPAEAKTLYLFTQGMGWTSAARELGISRSTVRTQLKRIRQRAASRGLAPEYQWHHPVPDPHRVKGNSTLYGPDGEVIQQWVKSERDSDEEQVATIAPIPDTHTKIGKISSLYDGLGNLRQRWVQQSPEDMIATAIAAMQAHVKIYAGLAKPVRAPKNTDSELLSVYPIGDPHIGMLAWGQETGQDFDLKIAERDLVRTIDMLVDRAPASRRALLCQLGDFWHAENDDQRTPNAGNKLDVDSRHGRVTRVGLTIMRRLIDRLLEKHETVEVANVPGNHDPTSSRWLNLYLEAVYERNPRVVILPNLNPYIYVRFGKNLIGTAHGDGAKPDQLPLIMAAQMPQDWGETDYHWWYTGHVHHLVKKEFPGCVQESFRTMAGKDSWHHWKGYISGQSLSVISLHIEYGEVTRSTVEIKLTRSAA